MTLDDQDHARVTVAIAEAERATAGEILVVAAARSDPYHDAVLHWALLAAFLVPLVGAMLPPAILEAATTPLLGWHGEDHGPRLILLFAIQVMVFLAVRYLIGLTPLRYRLVPAATRARRVRRRALAAFRVGAEARTRGRTGVLIYLSFAEHRAEIIADAAIHPLVPAEAWGEVMAELVDAVRADHPGDGMVAAVRRVGALIAPHFPPDAADVNEMPDRLIEVHE